MKRQQRVPLRIAADHPALAGHFPGFPIVPGVVLLDEALHAIELAQGDGAQAPPWHIGHVKFHHVTRAGEPLQLEFEWHADGQVHFVLRAGRMLVASGTVRPRARIRAVVSAR
jgi:3-hydroxymyristoyl/3-hydroxydecanoyl-(acyl carrier protein) dehydratase